VRPRGRVPAIGRTVTSPSSTRTSTCGRNCRPHGKSPKVEKVHKGALGFLAGASARYKINRLGLKVDYSYALRGHHLHAVAGKNVFLTVSTARFVASRVETGAVVSSRSGGLSQRGENFKKNSRFALGQRGLAQACRDLSKARVGAIEGIASAGSASTMACSLAAKVCRFTNYFRPRTISRNVRVTSGSGCGQCARRGST